MEFRSGALKGVGWLALGSYLIIGAVYFVGASILGLASCPQSTLSGTAFVPVTWLFWPVGVYNTLDFAGRYDLPPAEAWILRSCPSKVGALEAFQRGRNLKSAGRFDEALVSYRKSITLSPTYTALIDEGFLYLMPDRGEAANASQAFSQAIGLDPSVAVAYVGRGTAEIMLAQRDLQGLRQELWVDPTDTRLVTEDDRNAAQKLFREAAADLKKGVAIDPTIAEAHNGLGVTYAELGDDKTAIESYSSAIRIKPQYKSAYENRAKAYARIGEAAKSAADVATAASLPDQPKLGVGR